MLSVSEYSFISYCPVLKSHLETSMTIITIDITKSHAIVSCKMYLVLQQLRCSLLEMSFNQ